jgi:diguanylate cyclase (GGDEF)-like protein
MSLEALSVAAETQGTTTGDLLLRTSEGGILVVEPDPAEAQRISSYLREALGPTVSVTVVRSLASARRRVQDGDLALALLDLSIPGVSGLDGLRELQHADARLPVVVLADQSDQRLGLRAVKAGAQDFLVRTKVDAKALLQSIQYAVERKRSESRLAFLALHDPLTGLANRVQFRERLARALERCDRTRGRVGVLFLDLDHFKEVNDTLGHDAGDLLLKEVGQRLTQCVRSFEVVARQGGDEFVILLENLRGADDATAVARRILAALAKPIGLGPAERPVHTSIGVALSEPGDTVDSLTDKADRAMYRAKQSGRGTFAVYVSSSTTEELGRVRDDVGAGLRKLGFDVRFEPRMGADRDRALAAEASLTWRHPAYGPLVGDAVWSHFERAQVLDAVVPWWIEHCARAAARWDARHEMRVTIPVPDSYVLRPEFLEQLAEVLATVELEPSRIELLVTEELIRHDRRAVALGRLEAMAELGVRVAVDAFGGRCGLDDLSRLPVHTIKLHSELTRDITASSRRRALLKAVVDLARQLEIETVVKEVDTLEEEDALIEMGCTALAGTVVGPALPSEAFPIWLAHLESSDLV